MRTPLGCAAAMLALWSIVFVPMRADIEALQGRAMQAESEIQRAVDAAVALPALDQEVRALESALHALRSTASEPLDARAVLADLEAAATDSRIRITGIKPRVAPALSELHALSFELGVDGTFHDLGRFLDRIASSSRVMAATDVSVKAQPAGPGRGTIAGSVAIAAFDLSVEPSASGRYYEDTRRDPFAGPATPQGLKVIVAVQPARGGLAATTLSDVTVRGVARDGTRMLAILETASRQSFVVRPLDRLADAIVDDIDGSGVRFVQRTRPRRTGPGPQAAAALERGPAMNGARVACVLFVLLTSVSIVAQLPPGGPFTGSPIDVDYQGASLRSVLRQLSEIGGVNLVIDASVPASSVVDIKLTQVPWDQVLDIVLRSSGLTVQLDGTVVRVLSRDARIKEQDDQARERKVAEAAPELETTRIRLNYATAESMAKLIKDARVVSDRGTIEFEPRGNSSS